MKLENNDFKPRSWLLYLLIIISIIIVIVLASKYITDNKNKQDDAQGFFDIFDGDFNSDFDRYSFNNDFEMYMGTEKGLSVSRLIDNIVTNNKTNDKHIITVVYRDLNTTDVDEIRNIKKSLEDWTDYEVILDYDDNNYVYKITIEE